MTMICRVFPLADLWINIGVSVLSLAEKDQARSKKSTIILFHLLAITSIYVFQNLFSEKSQRKHKSGSLMNWKTYKLKLEKKRKFVKAN